MVSISTPRTNRTRRVALIFVAGIITASCSEKSADREQDANTSETPSGMVHQLESEKGERETELQPDEDQIAEDCVALVRATKVVPAGAARADCPGCPAAGTEMLTFRHMKTDSVSCSGDTCTALVTVHALFNPGSGERVAGGLTAWIPPEQRNAYLSGHPPSGEQVYRVRITYKHRGAAWQAVEFDRPPVE